MRCARCRAENPADKRFCGDCGAALREEAAAESAMPVPGEEGAFYCYRHRKEVTRVRCGRCERPLCTRCVVYGPAGVRCRDCARNRVPVRPRAMLHEAGRTLGDGGRGAGRAVWYLALWYFVIGLLSSLFGGRRDL